MRPLALCLALCLIGQGAWAEPPATSPRPMPARGMATVAPGAEQATAAAPQTSVRPMPRPGSGPADTVQPAETLEMVTVLRPRPRPEGLGEGAMMAAAPSALQEPLPESAPEAAPSPGKTKGADKGSVCGDPEIKGEVLAAIRGKVKGCGLENPVRVTQVAGIRLNEPATIDCETAAAFKTWINRGLRPAMGRREVIELRIAASYVCRPRNNKKGAKISEHGHGKAIDVAGFVFANGTHWSVEGDYNRQLRRAHKAACGIFGTTLGPGSDGYHEDHLHFDTASYRRGPYCR